METTFVDGINEPNKDNSGINENGQKGFSEWVNNEVTEIVKQNIYEEDFYQEKSIMSLPKLQEAVFGLIILLNGVRKSVVNGWILKKKLSM